MKLPLTLLVTFFLGAVAPTLSGAPLQRDVVINTALEIDELIIAAQKAKGITPNPVVDDATFVRRSYLNIIGRLPTADEARTFLKSKEEGKRADLVDTLVNSNGMDSRLFNYWSDLLRVQTRKEQSGLGWHVWLRKAVDENMPYDDMVKAMLSADGHSAANPAAGYYLRDRGMLLDNVSNTVQVFLGQQIGCAQCHDHPFDDTTQMEYYQLASFLGGMEFRYSGAQKKIREVIGLEPGGMMKRGKLRQQLTKEERAKISKLPKKMRREAIRKIRQKRNSGKRAKQKEARDLASIFRYHNRNALTDNPRKTLKLPDDYQYEDGKPGTVVTPGLLFGMKADNVAPEDRRKVFADWVTSTDNPYFTKVIANRLWEYAFGYGLVANPDDWSNSADPLYPEVITHLEKVMLATDYDVKEFLRILYHTRLFQREVALKEPGMGDAFDFTGPILRRLSAEELRDSFVTMGAGNIDKNRNQAFANSWDNYVESYNFIMAATGEQLRKINELSDTAEKARRAAQRQASELRRLAREANKKGDLPKAREITIALRRKQKEGNRKGNLGDSELAMKANAATMRRIPRINAGHRQQFRLRASELPAPQHGGSFVAEFGGSDRESPSSAHTHATVPQALRLLNGNETSLLTSRRNRFARTLRQMKTPEERLDFLFLTLYSAYPTESEKTTFLPEVKTPQATGTFARAILTSNRFLFVQ